MFEVTSYILALLPSSFFPFPSSLKVEDLQSHSKINFWLVVSSRDVAMLCLYSKQALKPLLQTLSICELRKSYLS